MQKRIWLTVLLVVVVGVIVYLEAIKPHQGPTTTVLQNIENGASSTAPDTNASGTPASGTAAAGNSATSTPLTGLATTGKLGLTPAEFLAGRASTVQQEEKQYQSAPEITDPTGWINTQPFTLSSLVGKKVVLLDFWTYSCINCLRTIPYLNAWYAKYKNAGLVIVGMHTPEFQFEHDYGNVSTAVTKLGIQYPVVLDSDMGTWDAYQNLYWPAEYLINIDGFIVHKSIGEGNYADTESAIQTALAQRDAALGLPNTVPTGTVNPSSAISISYDSVQSPETYFGAERNSLFGNGTALVNGVQSLTLPQTFAPDMFYMDGTWDFEDQYAESQTAGAKIIYAYNSKNVYIVAAAANTPVTAQVLLDGKPIDPSVAGSDVSSNGTITIQANRLYNIVQGTAYAAHTLELIVQQPGLQAYTFTFG